MTTQPHRGRIFSPQRNSLFQLAPMRPKQKNWQSNIFYEPGIQGEIKRFLHGTLSSAVKFKIKKMAQIEGFPHLTLEMAQDARLSDIKNLFKDREFQKLIACYGLDIELRLTSLQDDKGFDDFLAQNSKLITICS